MFCKRWGRYIVIYPILLAVCLNVLAWNSPSFCDFYVSHIFPLMVETQGRISGSFAFSVGEWMLVAAVLLVVVLIGGGVVGLAARRFFVWYRRYLALCGVIMALTVLIMTLNCLILFHVSPLTDAYQLREDSQAEEDADAVNERDRVEELAALRDYVVVSANELAGRLPRDEAGYLAAEAYPREDIADRARLEMARLGEQYDRLGGYYPRPKPFFFSEFFSQQYMMGYYFPFSMEANYNERMYVVNMPLVMCHELSHLKGFIYEDEANFLGFLACVDSEEELFRYSAYLSVIDYLDRDLYEALGSDPEAYRRHPAIGELVRQDNIFLTPTAWEQVEAGAVLPTALVKEVSGEFVEANLTINGVADGTVSYSRVVELLLWYYEGEPPVY